MIHSDERIERNLAAVRDGKLPLLVKDYLTAKGKQMVEPLKKELSTVNRALTSQNTDLDSDRQFVGICSTEKPGGNLFARLRALRKDLNTSGTIVEGGTLGEIEELIDNSVATLEACFSKLEHAVQQGGYPQCEIETRARGQLKIDAAGAAFNLGELASPD